MALGLDNIKVRNKQKKQMEKNNKRKRQNKQEMEGNVSHPKE